MNLRERQQQVRALLVAEQLDEAALDAGMDIYRNAYRMRLLEVLHNSFPRTLAWIGHEAFDTAARHYILLRPPSSFTLDVYGRDFPATLQPLFGNDPEVAELAWLEWSMQQAFAAIDEPVLEPAHLAAAAASGIALEEVPLRTVRSVALRTVNTNCADIGQALAGNTQPPAAQILEQPVHLLVWRRDLVPQFRLLEHDEQAALQQLAQGCTLADLAACVTSAAEAGDQPSEHAGDYEGDGAARLGEWLAGWIAAGLVTLPEALLDTRAGTARAFSR